MLGYYKDPATTAKVIDSDSARTDTEVAEQRWFNTGDLGFLNPGSGDLVLTGACGWVGFWGFGGGWRFSEVEWAGGCACVRIKAIHTIHPSFISNNPPTNPPNRLTQPKLGRVKDVIVLSNGENVEPQPIEDTILENAPLIDQVK